MIILRQKIFLVTFGLISFLFLFEASLRIAGHIYYGYRIKSRTPVLNDRNEIRILCIGDSFTFGAGAQKGYSYPEQLEKMLNKNNLHNFKVYNCGTPSFNSTQISKRLPEEIDKYLPNAIVVLMGTNNYWNPYGSEYYLFQTKRAKAYLYYLDAFFARMHIYKFLKMRTGSLADRFLIKRVSAACIQDSSISYKQAVSNKGFLNEEIKELFALGQEDLAALNLNDAADKFKRALGLDPSCEEVHLPLARIYIAQEKPFLAIEALNKLLEINPHDIEARNELWQLYWREGENELAIGEIRKILEISPYDKDLRSLLDTGLPNVKDERIFMKQYIYDLEKIIELAEDKKIKLILQSYPHIPRLNDVTRGIANNYKIPFIDNYAIFNELRVSSDCKYEDYFVEDGHCNNSGYRVMAENVYRTLQTILDL